MEEIGGFSKVEYLATFEAILLGFVASQYFAGWGLIVRDRDNIKFSYRFLMITFLTFTVLIIHWWNIWQSSVHSSISITNFISRLPNTFIYYSITVLMFKDIRPGKLCNLQHLYNKYRQKIWVLFLLYFVYDQFFTFNNHDAYYRYVSIALCLSGILIKKEKFHFILLSISSLVAMSYVIVYSDFVSPESLSLKNPYSKVEHLTVFLSFLYGYIIAEFFQGWSTIYKKFRRNLVSLNHVLWSAFAFFLLLDNWWGGWINRFYIAENLINFMVLLISPFLFYIISVLMFPYGKKENDFKSYFYENKKYIFTCFGLFFLINIFISIGYERFSIEYNENVLRIGGVVLAAMAVKISNLWFHRALVAVSIILLIINQVYN